jgi:hypothetical protein
MNVDFLLRAIKRVTGKNPGQADIGEYLASDSEYLDPRQFASDMNVNLASSQFSQDVLATIAQKLAILNTSSEPKPEELKKTKFISVTTLGKIIDTFIEKSTGVKGLMSEKDVTLVMGPIKISNPDDKTHNKTHSLYDLPIAMELLREVIRKMYTSKLKTKVSLRAFISTMLKEVRKYYMQGDLVLDAGKKLSANSLRAVQITCSMASKNKLRFGLSNIAKEGIRSDLRSLNTGKLSNLYCIVAGPADDAPEASLDNYVVGAIGSIVKKVNFTQVNSATMKARQDDNIVAAFRNNSNLGVIPQLYNAKMDIIGNLNFLPGYLFNLTPTILGVSTEIKDSIIKDLGLMGTFMTLKVNHSFSQDGFTTSLEAYNISTQKYINATIANTKKEDGK